MIEASDNGRDWKKIVVLAGGQGGARLLQGLATALPPGVVTAVVNTGDDFKHWGLHISPDIDTILYTTAGLTDQSSMENGSSYRAWETIAKFGGPEWLRIPDENLAAHVLRSQALSEGQSLSAFTRQLCERLSLRARLLPMSDSSQVTMINTRSHGTMGHAQWVSQHKCEPFIERIWFQGNAEPAPEVLDAIDEAELVIIAPCNPLVGIDPILCLRGVRRAVARTPTIAVSPIVKGRLLSGPMHKMMHQVTGVAPGAASIVAHYRALIRGLVVEKGDEDTVTGIPVLGAELSSNNILERLRLAKDVLRFASLIH